MFIIKRIISLHSQKSCTNKLSDCNKRIGSVDALRGIVLLGIILVHSANLFGYINIEIQNSFSSLGQKLIYWINFFLINRCAPVFNILFGVSFYLILRNPKAKSKKFAWRCFLLILIGIFNKLFYTFDVLMWYGFWGILLVSVRHFSAKYLLIIAIVTYILAKVLATFSLGDILFPISNRYYEGATLESIINYPILNAISDYLRVTFNSGIIGTFSLMIFGYYIGKSGLVENIKKWANLRNSILLLSFYIFLFIIGAKFNLQDLIKISYVFGFLFMSTCFLYLYCKTQGSRLLEAYGRMGLTNYSMQGIIGIISLTVYFIPRHIDFPLILTFMISFYILQCIFSYYWLKYFKYGPMEYIWRSLTNFKFVNPLKDKPKAESIPSLENT